MKNTPLFTVIMANYNNGRYIAEAIESVLRQTYTNWELFIVDDGSKDNSLEVCMGYSEDPRIHIIVNESNQGIGYAKWLGANESCGEIMAYLDADDVLEPDALEDMVIAHLQHPEWVLVGSRYRMLIGKEDLCSYNYPVGPQEEEPDDYLLSHPNRIVAFSSFKREAYNKTEGFGKTLRCTEDKDIYLKLEEAGGENCLGFIDKELYRYRQDNPNSLSLGSEWKKRYSQYHRAIVYLRAYERRYKRRSPRYEHYCSQYAIKMYDELICLVQNRQHVIEPCLSRYMWLYLKMHRFGNLALKRCLKLILRMY